MKFVGGVCLALLLWFGNLVSPAAAQDPYRITPRQKEIIQTIMNAQGGYIDAALYEEFWSAIPLTGAEKAWLVEQMQAFMVNGQVFTRESWASAEIALRTGSYTETDDYKRAKQKNFDALHAMGPGASTADFERSVANAERIIRGAANREPVDFGGGRIAYITEDLVATVLAGIDGSLDRVNLLLMPEWQPTEMEIALPEPGVKLLLPWHLARQNSVKELEQGVQLPTTFYSGALDETTFVDIGYVGFAGLKLASREVMFSAVRGAFKNAGIAFTGEPVLEPWRGHDSVTAWGTGSADGTPIAGYIRVFIPGARQGLSMVLLLRQGSMTELVGVVDGFEHKLSLVE
ncbi:hypothetical protein [Dongia sp.]|uniref:hypothetical protein n=1 Tax=Dongia sp. TaxID=1977262 RepID=UPI003751BB13